MEREKLSNWDSYQREEREEQKTVTGKLRCVITGAEEKTSKAGKPMIEITVRPSGCRFTVKTYLVQGEYFNRMATQFFDAFPEILDGDFNFLAWVGCEGAAMFDLDDRGYMRVKYFIDAVRAGDLPAFEGEKPEKQTITSIDDTEDDDEMPF